MDTLNLAVKNVKRDLGEASATLCLDNKKMISMTPENFKYNWEELVDEEVFVDGDLDLWDTRIRKLPKRLKVKGEVLLNGRAIKELPRDLEVSGDLLLYSETIKELPKGLKIGGELILWCKSIKELPENLEVNGDLNLRDTQIYKLGKNNKIKYAIHWPIKREEYLWRESIGINIDIKLTKHQILQRKLQLGY